MKNKILMVALSLLIVLGLYTGAGAYVLELYHIDSTITFTPQSTFGSTSRQHMNDALYKWNEASGKTLMKRTTSTHTDTQGAHKDGKNYVYKKALTGDEAAALAYTTTWSSSKDIVTEVDMVINSQISYANSAQPGQFDFFSVFLHETGHPAGLNDIYDDSYESSVMYYSLSDHVEKRTLATDDKNGIKRIYK